MQNQNTNPQLIILFTASWAKVFGIKLYIFLCFTFAFANGPQLVKSPRRAIKLLYAQCMSFKKPYTISQLTLLAFVNEKCYRFGFIVQPLLWVCVRVCVCLNHIHLSYQQLNIMKRMYFRCLKACLTDNGLLYGDSILCWCCE